MKKVLSVLCMALLAGGMIFTSCTKTFTITVNSNNDAWGTVTGGGTFNDQATTTLTATPKPGYKFVKWQDGVKENPYTITVTENATYTAYFEEIPQNETKVTFKGNTWKAANLVGVDQTADGYLGFYMFKTANSQQDLHVLGFFQPSAGTYDYQSSQGDYMTLRDPNFTYYDEDGSLSQDGQPGEYWGWIWVPNTLSEVITAIDLNATTMSATWSNDITDLETYDQTGNYGDSYTLSGVMTNASWTWASKSLNAKKSEKFQKVK
ncbi:MAG: hypothetical protein IKN78_03140 [Bacteroidales bacterium]|nr:hypothetical protein [Bacteroidales bacterium]